MAYRVITTPKTIDELRQIFYYFEEKFGNYSAGDRFLENVEKSKEVLANFPAMYQVNFFSEGSRMPIRKCPINNYSLFYCIDESLGVVTIIAALYNKRDFKSILEGRI